MSASISSVFKTPDIPDAWTEIALLETFAGIIIKRVTLNRGFLFLSFIFIFLRLYRDVCWLPRGFLVLRRKITPRWGQCKPFHTFVNFYIWLYHPSIQNWHTDHCLMIHHCKRRVGFFSDFYGSCKYNREGRVCRSMWMCSIKRHVNPHTQGILHRLPHLANHGKY